MGKSGKVHPWVHYFFVLCLRVSARVPGRLVNIRRKLQERRPAVGVYSPTGGRCGKAGNDFNSGCRTTGATPPFWRWPEWSCNLETLQVEVTLKTIGAGSESLATAKLHAVAKFGKEREILKA